MVIVHNLTPEVNPPVTNVKVNRTSVVNDNVAEITIPTYTAGTGISINNGIISLNLPQAKGGNY